ncbi:MAG: hypothetical protein U5N26_07605 [Candidatus Marinimicrobia bacterium]|nr:hypothetical protein [Candidatus Neomarinimicrobiota bacterium]
MSNAHLCRGSRPQVHRRKHRGRGAGPRQQLAERYGAEKIILGADFRNGRISVSGWQKDSPLELMDSRKATFHGE